ncbi:MAG: hypothetical protein AAB638_00810 [Patescibacteria group bacterium]
MKTPQLKIPEGQEIDTFDKASGAYTLKAKPKDVTKIKTILDVLRELGEEDEEVIIYKKLLTLFDATCHVVNYQLTVLIIRALNEKREPDWDSTAPKFTLYFLMASSGFLSRLRCLVYGFGCRLSPLLYGKEAWTTCH